MKERFITNPDYTMGRIFDLTKEEVTELCRPGEGEDTCVWLVWGGRAGFQCLYFNRRVTSINGEILEDRWKAGVTVAKRDGCDEIRKYEVES